MPYSMVSIDVISWKTNVKNCFSFAVKHIYKQSGFAGMYTGLGPSVLGTGIGAFAAIFTTIVSCFLFHLSRIAFVV